MTNHARDEGGDPACWAELFEDRSVTPLTDQQLADLVRHAADAIVVADTEGRISLWNDAAERIFGWTARDAIGQTLDLIIPERQRRAHWDGYARVMASGETRYGDQLLRVPALHADGERRSIAFTVSLLMEDGKVTGIAATIRDETQRWADEQELRRRLREMEAGAG
jgi:PAS domain S-box-containing protein